MLRLFSAVISEYGAAKAAQSRPPRRAWSNHWESQAAWTVPVHIGISRSILVLRPHKSTWISSFYRYFGRVSSTGFQNSIFFARNKLKIVKNFWILATAKKRNRRPGIGPEETGPPRRRDVYGKLPGRVVGVHRGSGRDKGDPGVVESSPRQSGVGQQPELHRQA